MRTCAFFPPSLDPVLNGRKGHKDAMVAPQVPTCGAGGHAILDHEPHGQVHHAVGVLTAGWGEIGEGRVAVLVALHTVMLHIRDHEITRTPQVEMAQVVQRPLGLLVPLGRVTTAWTPLPLVMATIGDDLWRGQVCHRGHPFGGIRPISTRTKHRFAFLVRMLEPKLYDTGSSKTIRKPGKDAIVSYLIRGYTTGGM
jgi:hypothetical protein